MIQYSVWPHQDHSNLFKSVPNSGKNKAAPKQGQGGWIKGGIFGCFGLFQKEGVFSLSMCLYGCWCDVVQSAVAVGMLLAFVCQVHQLWTFSAKVE